MLNKTSCFAALSIVVAFVGVSVSGNSSRVPAPCYIYTGTSATCPGPAGVFPCQKIIPAGPVGTPCGIWRQDFEFSFPGTTTAPVGSNAGYPAETEIERTCFLTMDCTKQVNLESGGFTCSIDLTTLDGGPIAIERYLNTDMPCASGE